MCFPRFRFRSCQIPNASFTIAGLHGRSRDQDGDSLDDEWEALNKLCPYAKDTTGLFSNHPVYRALGGDAEVVAEIYAYTHLLQVQNIWRHDWSDKGCKKVIHWNASSPSPGPITAQAETRLPTLTY